MSHLSTERLATMAEDAPTSAELAHLARCSLCAAERSAFERLTEVAVRESARLEMPITSWESLRPALAAEGLIADAPAARATGGRGRAWWLQAAAAVLLVAGGTLLGRASAGDPVLARASSARPASAGAAFAGDSLPRFASVDEARAAQQRSQFLYESATAFLAQWDTAPSTVAAKRVRLEALDRANQVFGAALSQAPNDPVISGSYLTTLGQREATLRQLNLVAPATMRIQSY
jgi:hypothetical protein